MPTRMVNQMGMCCLPGTTRQPSFYRAGDEELLALQGVSLRVESGDLVAVTGPSGSGKSTLLSCLAGMDDTDGGIVRITGQRISGRRTNNGSACHAPAIGNSMRRYTASP
jgi:putative ABC transport system ATP-binding protein